MENKINKTTPMNWVRSVVCLAVIGVMFHFTTFAETPPPNISFQVFYDELQPYGDWISDPMHGYVWVPYAEPGFQPYASNGHWVMSTYGNTWVSNYDWGWAPFHYGRWYFDDYLGWAWVPGYEWGPAWVNWRTGGGYYGWAPLMPGISMRVSVNIPTQYWVFVPQRRLISRNVYNYYVPHRNVYRVYNQTTVINNTYVYNNQTYVSGPPRREIERVSRSSVPVYQVNNSNRPGRTSVSRNTLQVYQPSTRQTATNRNVQAKPSRIVSPKEHQANLDNRRTTRTAPASRAASNSPTRTNSRNTEAARSSGTETRRTQTTEPRNVRNNQNNATTRTPAVDQRRASPQRESVQQSRQQAPASRQQPSSVPSRTQAPRQRTENHTAPRQQSAPAARQGRSAGQEVRRSTGSPTASPSRSRESSGSATRRSGTGSSSPRGNR